MTPNSFAPCAAFARETLSIPAVPYACERRPATKAAIAAAAREWQRLQARATRSHNVPVGNYRIHIHMSRDPDPTENGILTRPIFWVGIARGGIGASLDVSSVEVPALPVEGLPARIHEAALGLLARLADTLTGRAAALTTEAAAVRALIPTEPA